LASLNASMNFRTIRSRKISGRGLRRTSPRRRSVTGERQEGVGCLPRSQLVAAADARIEDEPERH